MTVQTTVEPDAPINFLRAKTVCGKLGATLVDGLVGGNLGNLKLPGQLLAASRRGNQKLVREPIPI